MGYTDGERESGRAGERERAREGGTECVRLTTDPMVQLQPLRTFDFFAAEVVPSRTPGSGATLKGDRVTAVERVALGEGATGSSSAGTTVDVVDEFYVGTNDGLVHRVRVEGRPGAMGCSMKGSFQAMEVERMGAVMGSRAEVFRIGHLARVRGAGLSSTIVSAPSASTTGYSGPSSGGRSGATPSKPSTPSKPAKPIGQRLYAMLGDAAGWKHADSVDEILVVAGYSRNNVVVRAWDVSGTAAGVDAVSGTAAELPPRLMAHRSVFKALKLLDSDIESVAIDTAAWPKVYVAVGTASGGIHVYCCGNVGVDAVGARPSAANAASPVGTSSAEFALVRSVEALKVKRSKTNPQGKTNRVHFVSFVPRPSSSAASSAAAQGPLLVWGASEHGDVIGFDALSTPDAPNAIMTREEVPGPLKRGCVAMDDRGALAVVTRDGVFYHTIQEGRTIAASVKSGENQAAVALGDGYLLILSEEGQDASSSSSFHQQHQRTRAPFASFGITRRAILQIVHVERKIVACSMSLPAPVRVTTAAAQTPTPTSSSMVTLYAVDGSGAVHRISERRLRGQVDALCDAKLFPQALRLCERAGDRDAGDVSVAALSARVNTLYGDYLFARGDVEPAMDAFINTIGLVETSHVIQKFLDGGVREIDELGRYLSALVDRGVATGDHISLLIRTYVGKNDASNIDALVEQLCLRRGNLAASIDAKAAVGVLRSAGFLQHALDIAHAYGEHEAYVSILVNGHRAYGETLEYLKAGPRAFASSQILRHGKVLIEHAPEATRELLMDLCIPPASPEYDDAYVADLASFSQLYADKPQDFRYLCRTILELGGTTANMRSRRTLYHSLLDIYLADRATAAAAAECTESADAPLDILRRGWPPGHESSYDPNIALTICALHGYHEGLVFIHMRTRRYRDALETLARIRDWPGVLGVCRAHGPSDPSLWRVALLAMVDAVGAGAPDEADRGDDVSAHLGELLAAIDDANAIAPVSVLEILARNPVLPFGVVKDYFMDILRDEIACTDAGAAEVGALTRKIVATKETLDGLDERPIVFKATRDSSTGAVLKVPAMHFLCGHSFNFIDGCGDGGGAGGGGGADGRAPACPICADEQDRARLLQVSRTAAAADHKDASWSDHLG